MTGTRRESRGRFGAWLFFACLLHVLPWAVLSLRSTAPSAAEGERSREAPDEIEITELPQPAAEESLGDAEASPQKHAAVPPISRSAPSVAALPAASDSAIDAAPSTASPPAGPTSDEALANAEDPAPKAPLSLDALGVGSRNPFVSAGTASAAPRRPVGASESARAVGVSRFKRSVAGEIARADQAHALGPEGPVLTSLENIVRTGDAELNATARFRFVTDAEGHLVSAELVDSSSDPRPWRRHAQAVLDALRTKKLRVPKTGYGVTFVVRVESRVQMPSGADPGTDITVLRIPVQKGSGPRSARIEILNLMPDLTLEEERLPSGQTASLPRVSVGNVLSLMGDLSDIGAKAQRIVRAHVERLSVNEVTK